MSRSWIWRIGALCSVVALSGCSPSATPSAPPTAAATAVAQTGATAQAAAPTVAAAAKPVATAAAQAAPTLASVAATAAPTALAAAQAAAGGGKLTDGKVVLALLTDMSGVYAQISGPNALKAVQMAVDDFKAKYGDNALGGPIEVISADHQNKPDLGNSKAQEMYDRDGADVILDVPTSSVALAVANVAKDRKKLYVNVGAATTDLTGAQCNKYTYSYAYDTYMLANGTGVEVTKQGGNKWYIVYPDYAFGQDMNKSFTAAIQKAGGTILASDATPFPNEDFSTYLLKAPSLQPTTLGVMQAGQDLVNVVKQYNEFKLKDQGISLAIGLLFDSDIKALGQDAYAGDLYTTAWVWNQDDQARQWADRFQKVTGVRPTWAQAGDYSAAWQYMDAVRRAGTDDADAVVNQLDNYKFEDFYVRNGMIRKEDHRVVHDAYLAQVKPSSEAKEDGDYANVLRTIPAEQAFRPISDSQAAGCKM
ncbi:MAG TPA: ABC transporter substrate-binding protein [Chloroflexota bacterium]